MNNKVKNLLKVFFMTMMVVVLSSNAAFAAQNGTYKSEYSDINQVSAEFTKELESEGIQVIGGKDFSILVDASTGKLATEESSDNVLKSSKASIVQVSWKIGYNKTLGLNFYTKAYSLDLNCLITSMSGMTGWEDPNSYATGVYSITTYNETGYYIIQNTVETEKTFSSGKVLDCFIYADINALNEITGGEYEAEDTVTIP
ncbi:MAG: hypothetical protein ACERKZ_04765 [Lachnotalea sp.]